jgi:hypothetical protein
MWSGARSGRGDGGRTPARLAWLLAAVLVPLSGCATTYPVVNAPGRPTTYEDPGTRGAVSGVGIESQDIVGMTDRMVRDMLGSKVLAGRSSPPRVIIDAEYFRNDWVARERDLKRQGAVDTGTTTLTKAQLGGDYRLGGRIVSLDQRSPSTGLMSRYNQITFEMVDLETGEIVWSGIYEFLKTAQDDVIYR